MRFCRSFLWFFLASLTLVPSLLAAQATVPAEIENEQVLGINKEPYHATLRIARLPPGPEA
jgi:hypothetical protein